MNIVKRIILLIIILLSPIIVNAQSKYEISELELIDKVGEAKEKEKASFSNGKLNIDVELANPGDSLKYQIKIKNIADIQYIMNVNTNELSNEYIKYTVEYENNSPIINPNQTKTIQLSIKMDKDISQKELMLNDGIYTDNKTINISLNNDNKIDNNPNTINNIIIILSIILITILLLSLLIKYKKARTILSILLIIYLLIPPQIIAIEKIDITIESKVEINKQDFYTIKESINNEYVYKQYPYVKGMTISEYIDTNYQNEIEGGLKSINCSYIYFTKYEYEECVNETNDSYTCRQNYPDGITNATYDSVIKNSSTGFYYIYFHGCCLSGETIIETKNKKTKKRKKKKLKDLDYDDLVLVWDFDNGCLEWAEPLWIQEKEKVPFYYELTFDDGTKLEVIGDHKIYDVDLDKFINCIEYDEFKVGSRTINDNNEIITLVSKERIEKENYAYNVITKNHINVFANSILTSWKINNLYDIESKKYIKDNNIPRVELDKDKIPEEYYKYLRLSEIPYNLNGNMKKTQKYIYDLINKLEKKKRK